MKLYYVANARMPNEKAHGIQIAKMCEAFVKAGIELELIVPVRKTLATGSVQSYYGLSTPIRTVRMPAIDFYNKGPQAFFLSSLTFMASSFAYLLWKRLRGERGIVYTIDMDLFSYALLPFAGMPVFTEMHSAKRGSFLYRHFFSSVRGVIPTNASNKDGLRDAFRIPEERFLVEPNGVDLGLFGAPIQKEEARDLLGLPKDEKMILYVGRIYPWKGLEIIPEAARSFPPGMRLYVLGGTEKELAETSGAAVPQSVRCVPPVPQEKVPLWLSAADALLVIGTKKNVDSYRYTSPMKIFEYLASGRPIVATDTPAIREILTEKEALLYAPDEAGDLVAKIGVAVNNQEMAHMLAERAKEKAGRFTWEARARRIAAFIRLRAPEFDENLDY